MISMNEMDDFAAAGIIDRAIPKHPLIWSPDPHLNVDELVEALCYAKRECGNDELGCCLKWARRIIYGKIG